MGEIRYRKNRACLSPKSTFCPIVRPQPAQLTQVSRAQVPQILRYFLVGAGFQDHFVILNSETKGSGRPLVASVGDPDLLPPHSFIQTLAQRL